jgi:hypothetical protein
MRQLCPPFLCACLCVVDELWPATINTEASVGRGSAADWSPAILSTRNLNGKLIKQLVGWRRSMIKWRPMSQHVKKNCWQREEKRDLGISLLWTGYCICMLYIYTWKNLQWLCVLCARFLPYRVHAFVAATIFIICRSIFLSGSFLSLYLVCNK